MKVYPIRIIKTRKSIFHRWQYKWRIDATNGRKMAGATEPYNNASENEDCMLTTYLSLKAHYDKEQFAHLDKVLASNCIRGNNSYPCTCKDVCEQCKTANG